MLSNISQLRLYNYSFKKDAFSEREAINNKESKYQLCNEQEVGVLAQEVETIIPDAVHKMVRK